MKPRISRPIKRLARRLGYDIVKVASDGEPPPVDLDPDTLSLYERVRPYTLTSIERVVALRDAVRYLVEAEIDGAFVECGVWKGGSMLVVVDTLLSLGVRDRELYLFDTFSGMPPPTVEDVDAWGTQVSEYYDAAIAEPFYDYEEGQVRALLSSTGYPSERLHFVKGMVEDTIPEHAPERVALCRLDTDFYVSTAHEMEHLFPRIAEGGVLLVDDYGHFAGSRQAVDEYFERIGQPALLHRIDYSGRIVEVTHGRTAPTRTS